MTDTSISTRVKAPVNTGACNRPASHGANMKGRTSSLSKDGSSWIMEGQQASKVDLRSVTRFATWNALTLNGVGYQVALVKQLAKYKIAIAGITEARLPGSDQRMVDDAIILHSGGTDHTRGVALVLRPPLKNSLVTWHPISPRLLYARLLHRRGHLSLVTAYAPTEDSEDLEKDSFYDQLVTDDDE